MYRRALLLLLVLLQVLPSSGCRRKESRPQKKPLKHAEALAQAEAERSAVNAFAGGLREAMAWRMTQDDAASDECRKGFLSRLRGIPVDGLPESLAASWKRFLQAVESHESSPEPATTGAASAIEAALELNRELFERGYADIRF